MTYMGKDPTMTSAGKDPAMTSKLVRSLRITVTALATAVAAILLVAAPASAHDNLLESDPSAGATVTSLDAVSMTFSGELIDFEQTSFAQVQGPDGPYYETSCSTIEFNVLTTPVALGDAGTYTVVWNAVSSDGHPISESFTFEYAPDASTQAALGWDLPACGSGEARVQPEAVPTATATPPGSEAISPAPAETSGAESSGAQSSTGGDLVVVLSIAAGVIVIAASVIGIVWLGRARKRRSE